MNNPLTAECVAALEQGAVLLTRLDDLTYSNTEGLPVQSGIGAHLRHCLDFYDCLLRGLPSCRIDYNQRPRDPQTETNRVYALRRLTAMQTALADLPLTDGATPLLVRAEDTGGGGRGAAFVGRRGLAGFLCAAVS